MIRFVGIAFLMLSVLSVAFGQEEAGDEKYISKGQWLVGGGFSFGAIEDFKSYNFSVSPMGGYFLGKKIAVGLSTGYGHSKSNYNSTSNGFSVQPFFRYYFTQKRLAPYGEIAYGASWSKFKYIDNTYNIPMEVKNTSALYKIGIGFDYFVNKNVAIESNLRYVNNPAYSSGSINFSVGLQFCIR